MIRAVAVLALAAIAPLLIGGDVVVLHNMILATAYAVMALGLNVIVGFAGLLDLGYVAFFAIGAYTAAYFASGYRNIHLNVVLVLALAVVTTGIAGALIGVPTLRLRGDYIAIVTLALARSSARSRSTGSGSSCSAARSRRVRSASARSTGSTCRASAASACSTCAPGTGSGSR